MCVCVLILALYSGSNLIHHYLTSLSLLSLATSSVADFEGAMTVVKALEGDHPTDKGIAKGGPSGRQSASAG